VGQSINSGPVCTFNGQTLNEGASVVAYQSSSVAYGQSCVSETRECSNGILNGSYSFASCGVGTPASCLFNGMTVAHGASVAAYAASTVSFGQACAMETRTCNNGQLSGSYTFASCSVGQPAACMFNGMTVAHGASVTAFASSTVPYGQTCAAQSQTRVCSNGSLSGSYSYGSCTVNQPASCLFNGQTIAHGASVTAYASSSVPYGQSCSSVAQSRVCSNGTLSGSAPFGSCTVAPAPAGKACHIVASPSQGPLCATAGAPSSRPFITMASPDLAACAKYCEGQNAGWCGIYFYNIGGPTYYCVAYAPDSFYLKPYNTPFTCPNDPANVTPGTVSNATIFGGSCD
jgi:hypothetical protein